MPRPWRPYLLTDFEKSSSGGIIGHRYLDLKDVLKNDLLNDLPELARQLKSRE